MTIASFIFYHELGFKTELKRDLPSSAANRYDKMVLGPSEHWKTQLRGIITLTQYNENDTTPARDRPDALTPEALREFDRVFLDWVDQNAEALEQGGSGDRKVLAAMIAGWARRFAS